MLAFLFVVSSSVSAEAMFLIPADNPKPKYPKTLYRAGITGDVRVSFTVHADGSVSKVMAAPGKAHAELVDASLTAVNRWRFKPWGVTSDRPPEIEVVAPMSFRLDSEIPIHANEELKRLTCGEVSREAQHLAVNFWVDMVVFRYTRSYLSHSFSSSQLSDERRLALIAKLNKSIPSIVRRCNTHPATRYVRFLPEEIRELL
ncbi:energy transducer TonB [Pseudomonas sp. GT1P32]